MPINVCWDNEHRTVIRYEFIDSWTWQDLHAAIDRVDELVRDVPYSVHFIVDMTCGDTLPDKFLSQIQSASRKVMNRDGLIVVINNNSFVHTVYGIFIRLNNNVMNRVVFAPTLHAARAHLEVALK